MGSQQLALASSLQGELHSRQSRKSAEERSESRLTEQEARFLAREAREAEKARKQSFHSLHEQTTEEKTTQEQGASTADGPKNKVVARGPMALVPQDLSWWGDYQPHVVLLREALVSSAPDIAVLGPLNGCFTFYKSHFHNGVLSSTYARTMILGANVSRLESPFMWLGGWRPTSALVLVYSLMAIEIEKSLEAARLGKSVAKSNNSSLLSPRQLAGLHTLQEQIQRAEIKISKKLALFQMELGNQDMLKAVLQDAASEKENDSSRFNRVVEKRKSQFRRLLLHAEELRLRTLKDLLSLLTPIQAARCGVAIFDFCSSIRALGNFQAVPLPTVASLPLVTAVPTIALLPTAVVPVETGVGDTTLATVPSLPAVTIPVPPGVADASTLPTVALLPASVTFPLQSGIADASSLPTVALLPASVTVPGENTSSPTVPLLSSVTVSEQPGVADASSLSTIELQTASVNGHVEKIFSPTVPLLPVTITMQPEVADASSLLTIALFPASETVPVENTTPYTVPMLSTVTIPVQPGVADASSLPTVTLLPGCITIPVKNGAADTSIVGNQHNQEFELLHRNTPDIVTMAPLDNNNLVAAQIHLLMPSQIRCV